MGVGNGRHEAMSCVFCAIAAGDLASDLVAEDDAGVAFLDLEPKSPGHTLVVPRAHVADLTDGAEEFARIAPLVTATAADLQRRLGARGINLVVNSGAAAGQEVPHLHVHLVPRYGDAPQPADRQAVLERLTAR